MIRQHWMFACLTMLLAGCGTGQNGKSDARTNPQARAATPLASPVLTPAPASALAEHLAADGKVRTIAFHNGSSVQISPILITGRRPGIVAECAVRINGQLLRTIGEEGSRTEVIECHRLDAAGALPAADATRRIGLIYDSGTPNAEFKTPIVLTEQSDKLWQIDDDAFDRLDGTSGNRSIETMGKVLSQRP